MSGNEYKVPSMKEIEAIPWNGYNVVSTFSGGGGSCTGYRMAGYHVIWANEFVEEAQNTYRANHAGTILDCRDIREVKPEEILLATGLKKGEIDLFDGSPPCCAFSTNGKREKGWNQERDYSDGKKQRIEDLFEEYIRLVDGTQPKTFVAENVSGMVKGVAIGYFKDYLRKMQRCGYKVEAKLLNSKYLGVPQARERIIFVGVREDLGFEPVFPKPKLPVLTLNDAFKGLVQDDEQRQWLLDKWKETSIYKCCISKMRKNPSKVLYWGAISHEKSRFNLLRASMYQPANTVLQSCGIGGCMPIHPLEDRSYTIPELKRLTSIPDDFILTGKYEQQYERLGRMVPPLMTMAVAKTIQTEILDKIEVQK